MRASLLSAFVLLAGGAALRAEPMPADAGCSLPPQAQPCPQPRPSLRALRLQNAVQNGDLSPAEATRLLHQEKRPPDSASPDHPDPDASPPQLNHPGKHSHRFWREQRKHLDAVAPPVDPD
jgi:hypothetical protein